MLCKRRRRDPREDYEQRKEPAKVTATLHIQTVTLSFMEDNGRMPHPDEASPGRFVDQGEYDAAVFLILERYA